MGRRLLALLFLCCPFVQAIPAWAFDSSEYRQNTYGPPTHYCDPTRALNNNGTGTLANPWNLLQCQSQPVAGNVVGVLPGVGVPLTSTDDDNIPTFLPANSGTASQPIVYVTKYAAVALSNVATNPNRTQLRHNGTRPSVSGGREYGTGSPMYGVNTRNYIIFDGFYVDVTEAWTCGDCGMIRAENATGIQFLNFVLKGTTVNVESNPTMIRTGGTINTVIKNFKLMDFANDSTGSMTPQQGFAWIGYGDRNYLVSNFEITNVQRGLFPKGTYGGEYNYGTIQYGKFSTIQQCFQLNDTHPSGMTTIQYNVCDGYTLHALRISSETQAARNLLVHHNTFVRGDATNTNHAGAIYARPTGFSGTNVTIRDNLFDRSAGSYGHMINWGETATLPNVMNYNGYYRPSGVYDWAWNGVAYSSWTTWRSTIGREMNSLVLASDPFVSRSGGDFRIVTGHAARTASSTGGELGAYADGAQPGVDLSTGGSAPSGGGGDVSPPSAPSDLRIVN